MSNIVDTANALGQAASQQSNTNAPKPVQNPVSVQDSSGNVIRLSQQPVNLIKSVQHQAPRTTYVKTSNSLK